MEQLSTFANKKQSLTAKDVIRRKGPQVITATPDQKILEVSRILAEHSVGSLLVVDADHNILGILSERDVTRALAEDYEAFPQLQVKDLMSKRVIIGLADDCLDSIMALMTAERIRHLPIAANGRLIGILSIGDIVKAKAAHADGVVRYLTDFINGKYPN